LPEETLAPLHPQAEKALVTASDATHVHSADIQPEARFIWSIWAFRSNFFKSSQMSAESHRANHYTMRLSVFVQAVFFNE
jgi:hypothetical protein